MNKIKTITATIIDNNDKKKNLNSNGGGVDIQFDFPGDNKMMIVGTFQNGIISLYYDGLSIMHG